MSTTTMTTETRSSSPSIRATTMTTETATSSAPATTSTQASSTAPATSPAPAPATSSAPAIVASLAPSLRYRIQGAWQLDSYKAIPVDLTGPPITRRPFFPMTKHVTGIILYTPDGYYSAQMQIPGQAAFPIDDQNGWAESAKRYYAYSGPFYVTKDPGRDSETLRHQMTICVSPGEAGKVQLRSWKIELEDEPEGGGKRRVLVLGTEKPVIRKGRSCHLELRYRKMVDNSHGKAPPDLQESA